ncbi:hypothetical protein CLV90_2564 [Maribacter spongiicola]|uniref:Erythromycin esterase n=1 Tax=Maribacter spongiicola TaxID=1206753 RepID=A0A4R7K4H6_9FLAO|nr:hypothetical protein [Maribacter spongiicola]TDT45476.1 hypothetical protein CLV90_2564 [Maribacter spongiicola]
MKRLFTVLFTLLSLHSYSQSKVDYLENNRFDMTGPNFDFPQKDFNIIGFGAYHGSVKTEAVEHALLTSLTKVDAIQYYLPETDFSLGHYFNTYLQTGDTLLLKDLVINYGARVPQERSIETYEKWKGIKDLNDKLPRKNRFSVVGIDQVVTYKYTARHLLELLNSDKIQDNAVQQLEQMVALDTTDYSPYYDSYSKSIMKAFVESYEANTALFSKSVIDKFAFNHIIQDLKYSFNPDVNREEVIFNNYVHLDSIYNFKQKPQFLRFGFFHLEKQREGNNPSFFTRLIENNFYPRNKVISVIGYFTDSRVLWDHLYDDNGTYQSFTTEGGFGIGDYEKEYFLGIEHLKKSKFSDMTLFRLNATDTPYSDGMPDLIEVVTQDEPSNGEAVKRKSTTEFIDYAILISNSKANTPIEELK